MKKAIVTGATGFIGSWLTEELLAHDYAVTVIVRNKENLLPSILDSHNCIVIQKNLEELNIDDFHDSNYDAFYHLAWNGVSTKDKNDISGQLHNTEMSIKSLETAACLNCRKFIAAGTVAEYALSDNVIDLNEQKTPNDMYGAAKVSTYYYLEIRAKQLKQPFNWVIIPSTFGERRRNDNIITYTISKLLKGEKPKYGSLDQMWDFLYVGEVVRALRLIGERGKDNKNYGIGSGVYHPLKEYVFMIRDLINPQLSLGIGEIPSMSKKSYSSCVNIYDLIKDTGFQPKVSFESGIKNTINYYADILNRVGRIN